MTLIIAIDDNPLKSLISLGLESRKKERMLFSESGKGEAMIYSLPSAMRSASILLKKI